MREKGIDARPFWKPAHLQTPYADSPRSTMNVTEDVFPRVLTLPCSTGLTEEDQAYVVKALSGIVAGLR